MWSPNFIKDRESTVNTIQIFFPWAEEYRQISSIWHNFVGNKLVDHSDVGAAPTTSSFST